MSIIQHVEKCIINQQTHKALNAFISLAKPEILKQSVQTIDSARNGIAGRLIGIKDNICTQGDLPTTCASAILENYKSPYEATLVRRLRDVGALIAGKTNLDEFGMGSHSLNTADPVLGKSSTQERQVSAGGSSGGSAVAVATEQCWAAIGTDTGGSVRLPAAYNEVVGFKPSYGMISRFGVVAYANSLDTVGILANSTGIVRQIYDIISGSDSQDPTCLDEVSRESIQKARSRKDPAKSLRIGIPREYNIAEVQPEIRNAWKETAELLRGQGHTIHSVSLPSTQKALSAYYVLAPAEASSNLARYDGIRYGSPLYPGASYSATRGARLGAEVQRRILLGTFSLSSTAMDNYFIQAQKIRRLVQNEFNIVFRSRHPLLENTDDEHEGVDLLLCPTAPSTPPLISALKTRSPVENYQDDVFTVPASLAGLPAINIPYRSGSNIGMQLIGQYGSDDLVLGAGQILETCMRGE